MASVLKDDPFLRRRQSGSEPARFAARGNRGAAIATLMLVSIGLLALSRLDHSVVRAGRGMLSELTTPILAGAMVPFRPLQRQVRSIVELIDIQKDAERLRDDNQRLKGWEGRAKELERRLVQLEEIARVLPEQTMTFATARVIADSGGPFVRMALIDAGRGAGFKNGFPVINVDGLVGRITASGQRSSRLLLLTDLNSRIPVYIGSSSVRAIMSGDNGPYPKLAHIPADAKVEPGDDVVTSGVGGLMPRGLRIGTVIDAGDQLRVALHAHLDRLEYVSVLFYDGPGTPFADEQREPYQPAKRRTPALSSPLETGSVTP